MFFVLLVNLFHRADFIIILLTLLANGIISLDETLSTNKATGQTISVQKPNFVVLLVDDLGVGDIGCFGNDTIKTPNVDRLAERGAKLNHNLSPESICTPSRAAMLTGRYAIRSGLASGPGEIRVISSLASSAGLPNNETTFAEVLQENGYRTSKWLKSAFNNLIYAARWGMVAHCSHSKYNSNTRKNI
jgi:arylsulfatase A-like enzyme